MATILKCNRCGKKPIGVCKKDTELKIYEYGFQDPCTKKIVGWDSDIDVVIADWNRFIEWRNEIDTMPIAESDITQ